MPAEYNEWLPIAPNHAEKWARYEQHENEYTDKRQKKTEGVTSEKRRGEIVREDRIRISGSKGRDNDRRHDPTECCQIS